MVTVSLEDTYYKFGYYKQQVAVELATNAILQISFYSGHVIRLRLVITKSMCSNV